MEKEKEDKYKALMDDYPILFARRKFKSNRTCMCWGIEAGTGWYYPLRDLCNQLEAINLTTGKQFGLMIRAEQVKEKFGTLRFYYDIELKISWWRKLIALPFDILAWIFDTKFVSEKINNDTESGSSASTYKVVWHPRWRYWLHSKFHDIAYQIKCSTRTNTAVDTIRGAITYIVDKLITNAEVECMQYCENCGQQIGTEWSPKCETVGWTNYLCNECADKRNVVYVKHLPNNERRFFVNKTDITDKYLNQQEKSRKTPSTKKTAKKPVKQTAKKSTKKTTTDNLSKKS